MKKLINFFKDEEGVTMVEYGLIAALISIVAISILVLMSTEVKRIYQAILDALEQAPTGGGTSS
jgi:pilus assembly protein Flp/PilA